MDKSIFLRQMEEILGLDEGGLNGSESLSDIPSWDSLSILAVIAMVDDMTGLSLTIEAFINVKTVDDIHALITNI